MSEKDTSLPVQELINRYQKELLDFQKQHTAVMASVTPTVSENNSSVTPTDPDLDREFPEPHFEQDLASMRAENNSMTSSVQDSENNAVQNENDGDSNQNATTPPNTSPKPLPDNMSLGYLKVAVTTGRGALPIRGALVRVASSDENNPNLEQVRLTDESGNTPLFTLPAISGSSSMSPDNSNPYTYYNVQVRAKGFYPIRFLNVPLYGGITSVQQVDLIPVAEGGDPNRFSTVVDGSPENLQ